MHVSADGEVADEVMDALSAQPGQEISNLMTVSARPGWSTSLTGKARKRKVHIKLIRSVRDDAFRAQEAASLAGVIRYIELAELPHQLSTGARFVAIREMQGTTLARMMHRIVGWESPEALRSRSKILHGVISGVQSLHAIKVVHGDIKPDNIAFNSKSAHARLMDFGSPLPASQLQGDEFRYRGPGKLGTFAADIFSIGALIEQFMISLPSRSDSVIEGLSVRQLRWLADAARWSDARERPTADVLMAVLFQREDMTALATESVQDAARHLLRMVNRENANLLSLSKIQSLSSAVMSRGMRGFQVAPETMIIANRETRLAALLANVSVDIADWTVHTHQHEDDSVVPSEYVKEFPGSIDTEFERRIKQDVRRVHGSADSDVTQEADQQARIFFDALRLQLLHEANYFDEEGLARLMSRPGELAVSAAQVSVLRQWRELIAVPDHDRWLYPDFQFDPITGSAFPEVQAVAERFVEDEDPWAILSWWLTPHRRLRGQTPAAALHNASLRSSLLDVLPPASLQRAS